VVWPSGGLLTWWGELDGTGISIPGNFDSPQSSASNTGRVGYDSRRLRAGTIGVSTPPERSPPLVRQRRAGSLDRFGDSLPGDDDGGIDFGKGRSLDQTLPGTPAGLCFRGNNSTSVSG
jgi:hypothetical protein